MVQLLLLFVLFTINSFINFLLKIKIIKEEIRI